MRLQFALEVAEDRVEYGWFAHIIVSGGLGREGYDEAEVMKQYLISRGLPADRIYVDSKGDNTYLTARNVARMIEEKQMRGVLIISQYFHISRTRLALARFGVSPLYSAHADIFEWRDLYSTVREVIGFYVYFFRSYPRPIISEIQLRCTLGANPTTSFCQPNSTPAAPAYL